MDGASSLVTMLTPLSVNLGAEEARQSAKNRPIVPKTQSSQNPQSQKSILNGQNDQGQNSSAYIQAQTQSNSDLNQNTNIQTAVSIHTTLENTNKKKIKEKEGSSAQSEGRKFKESQNKDADNLAKHTVNLLSSDRSEKNFAKTLNTKHEFSGIAKLYNSIKPNHNLGKFLNLRA